MKNLGRKRGQKWELGRGWKMAGDIGLVRGLGYRGWGSVFSEHYA